MTEPAGVFSGIKITESNSKKLLNHKFPTATLGKKVGYYFSSLLPGLKIITTTIELKN